ncbi:hypothetical protein GCM10011390_07000 [Aureimonas endophytica]|uniref:Molybdopterin molybdenumtransferase n=1 Tax=Aureimonas endophytica TaxID=2027858 RepID=A0A917E1Y5_9HYPH|nr:hypothetical protein GCM10011390_07000 [Aureimonas endophytica]
MRFGPWPLAGAEGAILAHAAKLETGRIAKGTRLGPDEIARLGAAGIASVTGARLDPGDLAEDEAAAALSAALAADGIEAAPAATGRVNLFARGAGLLVVERASVDGVNRVDAGLTLATLSEFAPVGEGQMVATVKIIPLAVPGEAVRRAAALLRARPALRLARFRPQRVALVQTRLAGLKESVLDKTRRVTDERLAPAGSAIVEERRCDHAAEALADALTSLGDCDLAIVFGASAVIDAEDVIPSAIRLAGGDVDHLGMPVDPGNLLLVGRFRDRPILGAPGCARSAKENGFDWVVNRLLADIHVTSEDIRAMGVGGLLAEIPSRPQPRQPAGR